MTRTATSSEDSPQACPNCGADVDEWDAYVGGIDRVCTLCLIDLPAAENGATLRRRQVRIRRRRIGSATGRVTFPFDAV
jgi:hypothetical protein